MFCGWPLASMRVVEGEAELVGLVHVLDQVAELGGQPARADELHVAGPAAEVTAVLRRAGDVGRRAAADHVHVELRDDRVARHRRMVREVLGAEEARLFARVPDEEDRALRLRSAPWRTPRRSRARSSSPSRRRRRRCRSSRHARAAVRLAQAVGQGADARDLLVRGLDPRGAVGALRPRDHHEGLQRVVIDRLGVEADVIVVRADGDVLALERRVGARQDRDDVATRARAPRAARRFPRWACRPRPP